MEHRKRAAQLPHRAGVVALDAEGERKADGTDLATERRAEAGHPPRSEAEQWRNAGGSAARLVWQTLAG